MKIWLRLVYGGGDVAATLLRPWRWSYAFVALLYPFYIESGIQVRFYYDLGASTALLLRFYCALAVSPTILVILTKNRIVADSRPSLARVVRHHRT